MVTWIGLFSLTCKDNVDVNGSSNIIKSHYHGTSQSILQFATWDNSGKKFPEVNISAPFAHKSTRLSPLPANYVDFNRDLLPSQPISGPLCAPLCTINFEDITAFTDTNVAIYDEIAWLDLVQHSIENISELAPAWAQHHAAQKRSAVQPPGINTISPLLRDKVNTLKMQAHCMVLNKNTTKILNPGQTPCRCM